MVASNSVSEIELPLQLKISFKKVFVMFEKYAKINFKEHPFHDAAIKMVNLFEKHPELNDGFSDYSLLETYKEQIDLLLNPLFPEPLSLNEIKAATVPFSFSSFKFSDRFTTIIENAGEDYELKVRNFEDSSMYVMACTFILGHVYGYNIDIKRPFYFDIPDKITGTMKYYRATFNADFSEVIATENAQN